MTRPPSQTRPDPVRALLEETSSIPAQHSAGGPSANGKRRVSLLAVDDFPSDLKILARAVSAIGDWEADLVSCLGPAEFLAALESRTFDVLLIDYTLGAVNGIELLKEARQAGTDCPAIFLTVRDDARSAVHALQAGAVDFISKDQLTSEWLKRAVEGAIERRNLQLAITEYRKRLERAKESLERRNEEIRSFYRTITQDLTTPLGSALQLLNGLLEGGDGALAAGHRESIEAIRESCNQIALCLKDVLDVGRLEAGSLAMWVKPDDLGEVVERAIATLEPRARSLGVSIEVRVEPGLEPGLIDRQRVGQVLTNLVDHALQFTPAGGRIEVEANEDPIDPGFLDVSVSDTGPGMDPAAVQRMLTIFCSTEVVGPGRTREIAAAQAAIGYGLQLCHEIVRLHRGEITVESQIGEGTTFSFTLPKAGEEEARSSSDSQRHATSGSPAGR
ncbi:MAG: ATP-binding protein [Planctomycetota bacterium]